MADEIIGIKITTDAAQATKDVQNLDKAFTDTDNSVKSLRTQLREAQAQVGLMADKFGATSKEAIEAAKRAADLKDRIGDAKALTDAFNPDAKFKAVASSLAGVAGGFSALQGAMALFGKENKDVEAALLKVNAAMALSQGLQAVGESVDSFRQLGAVIKSTTAFQELNNAATKTAAAVQRSFGISVETTSTGFKVLKGAIVATGIGALVVLLGEVINNFDAISNWIKNSPLGSLAKGVGNLVEQFTDFIGVTSEAERNLNKLSVANKRANEDIESRIKVLKAQGGSEKEIYDLSQQRVNNELNILRESLKTKGKLSEEEAKQFRDLKTEQLVLTADYNKKTADANAKAAEEAKKKRDEANKQAIEDKKTADKMLLDLQNEKALAEIASEDDKAKKQAEINKNARIAEIDALQVDIKTKNELKKTTEEAFQLEVKAIDDKIKAERAEKDKKFEEELQKTLSEARIAKFKEGKEKEVAALDEALAVETKKILDNADYTEKQKGDLVNALKDKYGADVQAINEKYDKIDAQKSIDKLDSLIKDNDLTFKEKKAAIDKEQQALDKLYADKKISEEDYTALNKKLSDARIAIGDEEAKKRAEQMNKIKATLGNVAKAFGEHTLAGKAAAIALTTIETYQSAVSAFNSLSKIPIVGVPLGIAAAAAAIKMGLDNIKRISAVKAPTVSGGSSEAGFVDIPSPNMPSGGGGGSVPSLGNATPDLGTGGGGVGAGGGGQTPTIRAYVVERDISDAQSRDAEIQNRARFE
jgi:hypothetical protein